MVTVALPHKKDNDIDTHFECGGIHFMNLIIAFRDQFYNL
jgi:hypothetical protein